MSAVSLAGTVLAAVPVSPHSFQANGARNALSGVVVAPPASNRTDYTSAPFVAAMLGKARPCDGEIFRACEERASEG
jgi:hypothetical protein